MRFSSISYVVLLCASVFLTVPFFAFAQQGDLQTTIRAAISQDPRAANMSAGQIDSLVAALTQKAQQQNMTPQDIVWRPATESVSQEALVTNFCPPFPQLFCALNESFGFNGPDYIIPAWLASSALLLMILVALRRRHARPVVTPAAPVGY